MKWLITEYSILNLKILIKCKDNKFFYCLPNSSILICITVAIESARDLAA